MIKPEYITKLKQIGWIAGIFLVAILVISAVERKGDRLIKDVIIDIEPLEDGHALIKAEDIQLSIDRSFGFPLNTLPVRELDVERLERVLEEDPFILDADVYVDARSQVKIWVRQREPVLRIIDNNGLNYYLDDSGFKMPLSKHFSARVLVATGNIPPHVPDFLDRKKHMLKDLFELAERIRKDKFLQAMIEQIYVSNRNELTLAPKLGRHTILFGRYADVESKLQRLEIFYREGLPYEGWRKYETIDLRYNGQVVCK